MPSYAMVLSHLLGRYATDGIISRLNEKNGIFEQG